MKTFIAIVAILFTLYSLATGILWSAMNEVRSIRQAIEFKLNP